MNKANNYDKKYGAGVGALDLLTIAFIILKLCNVIDWSWWVVLLPTLIPAAIVILCIVITAILHHIEKHLADQ